MTISLWSALASPFAPGEVKTRPQGKMTLSYVTARTVMNRLDEVLGPENWWDDYSPFEHSVICRLTIRLADGREVTKSDAGGMAGMSDAGDDDKSGFSDAFKRAAVKFGVGRYLYRDGVPSFATDAPQLVEGGGSRVEGNNSTGFPSTNPPPTTLHPSPVRRDGAWLKGMAAKRGALDWFADYGSKHGLRPDIALWSKHQVELALEARRKWNRANGRLEAHS